MYYQRLIGALGNSRMTLHSVARISEALKALDSAVDHAARTAETLGQYDHEMQQRMVSYKEVVRRQTLLIERLRRAANLGDWRSVSRLTELVRTSSLMLQTDAEFLIQYLRDQKATRRAA